MAIDLKKIRADVAEQAPDLTNPNAGGGGDFAPPAEGLTRTRLVGYVEVGVHTTKSIHGAKTKPRSWQFFELSGPKHEPKVLDNGDKLPFRIRTKEIVGTHVKNGYIKLFNQLNHDGTAKNFVDLLMDYAWLAKVSHYKFKRADGKEGVVAQLKTNQVYSFSPVTFEDPATGDMRTVAVPPALSAPMLFLWDSPDLDQWDSIKIDGARDDGSSKNYIQDEIRKAENFVGSPIYQLLIESGRKDEAIPLAADAPQDEDAPAPPGGEDKPEASSLTEPAAKPVAKPAAKKAPAKAVAAPKPEPEPLPPVDDSDPLAGV
jgi:hypothetical protein